MDRVFVDSSAWLSYVNRLDTAHRAVRTALAQFGGRLVTSNFVFDETVTLCRYRLGRNVALLVGETLRDPAVVDLARVEAADENAAWELFAARADKRYSFTDCTSFVLMQRLGLRKAITLDSDFEREGFEVVRG